MAQQTLDPRPLSEELEIEAMGATDVGRQRPVNEDAFLVDRELGLFAVADGLGGHAGGEVASRLAIDALHSSCREHRDPAAGDPMLEVLAGAAQRANSSILDRSASDLHLQRMSTTLTAAWIRGTRAHFVHVGDSRAYLLREGGGTRLTEDHNVAGLRGGGTLASPPDAAGRKLLAALGFAPQVGLDLFAHPLRHGDLLLLCTDGLTAHLSEAELAALGLRRGTLSARIAGLLELALSRGGRDNLTVVLVAVREPDTARLEGTDVGAR